jgi:hypothetical protein
MSLKLNKSLYGLKQAPRCWHQRLHQQLLAMDFKVSEADPGLYISTDPKVTAYILVYVDDLALATKGEEAKSKIKTSLLKVFDGRDLGPINSFFFSSWLHGVRAPSTPTWASLCNVTAVPSPSPSATSAWSTTWCPSMAWKTATQGAYPSVLPPWSAPQRSHWTSSCFPTGSLMHLAVTVRPDISYAV